MYSASSIDVATVGRLLDPQLIDPSASCNTNLLMLRCLSEFSLMNFLCRNRIVYDCLSRWISMPRKNATAPTGSRGSVADFVAK
jgi:hypothetical protein